MTSRALRARAARRDPELHRASTIRTEPPVAPEVTLDTTRCAVEDAVDVGHARDRDASSRAASATPQARPHGPPRPARAPQRSHPARGLRELQAAGMLWSIGKDSTVLLWLARKAFFGHVPFPLVHIDTSFKIPEMIRVPRSARRRVEPQPDLRAERRGAGRRTDLSRTAPSIASPAARCSRPRR